MQVKISWIWNNIVQSKTEGICHSKVVLTEDIIRHSVNIRMLIFLLGS